MKSKLFRENLDNLGVSWKKDDKWVAPEYSEIQTIERRVIIGQNGCGKSRLLRALDNTLEANKVLKRDILYADFPKMARNEFALSGDFSRNLERLTEGRLTSADLRDVLSQIGDNPSDAITAFLESDDKDCKKAFKEFSDFAKILLGNDFESGSVARRLKPDDENSKPYSPGQRCLLYMSFILGILAAHRHDDSIYILLDEPDQHLHPIVAIDFINHLTQKLDKARLWVATHSVHLMAMDNFKFYDIIYIKNGEVQSSDSKMYDNICETMVDTEGMRKLVAFSGMYGFYAFFKECFDEPDSEITIKGNTLNPLKKEIEEIRKLGIKKILDYGAGKGRFFELLSIIPNIEYYAYDYKEENFDELAKLIPADRIYSNICVKAKPIPQNSDFDAVLLINTLHEISHDEWAEAFKIIKNALADDGHLFFCETVPLITGEFIGNTGFLVLGVDEQKVLFGDEVEPKRFGDKDENGIFQEGKLHFSRVPRNAIPELSDEKRISVLSALEKNSYKKWLITREMARDKENNTARNTAFYAVQHLNAETALNPNKLKVVCVNGVMRLALDFGAKEWLILDEDDNNFLLVSTYAFENYRFPQLSETVKNDTVLAREATNTLQKTLNNEITYEDGGDFFFDRCGFSDKDRERICGRVFLLSLEEIEKCFGDIDDRKIAKDENGNAVDWWVEVSSEAQDDITFITKDGEVKTQKRWEVKGIKICGLRPALRLAKLKTFSMADPSETENVNSEEPETAVIS